MQQTETEIERAYREDRAQGLALVEEIEGWLDDLPAPDFEGFRPTWGHVGDLELVLTYLRRARDVLAGEGAGL